MFGFVDPTTFPDIESFSPFTDDNEGCPYWRGSFGIDLVGNIGNMIEFAVSGSQTKIAASNEVAIPDTYRFIVLRMWKTPAFASCNPMIKANATAF